MLITVKGVVQGVGFRPFVYRIAKKNNIHGYVRNVSNSVEIFTEGSEENIKRFLKMLKNEHPPLAEIYSIEIEKAVKKKYDSVASAKGIRSCLRNSVASTKDSRSSEGRLADMPASLRKSCYRNDFYVLKSGSRGESGSAIPPDVSICGKCLKEIFDRRNRRYLYPFTVCTDCGPRFTIIEALPYDRERTTMRQFKMCPACGDEYENPLNRRFRAEPTCCRKCGPAYELFADGRKLEVNQLEEAARALDSGKIVAVKGVGGTHLAAKTTEDEALLKIREILHRPQKPFAVMARSISAVKKIAYVSREEEKILTSFRKPIVLLRKKRKLSEYISPKLHNIGVMLPYAGVHHLLFHYSSEPAFVMTSANIPGEPMAIDNKEIIALNAEYSLLHNRGIKNRCDDSVVKFIAGKPSFLRRSRGFVPSPVELKISSKENILALGAELDVTACILKENKAFVSQYIGNTTKLKTLEYLEKAVYNLVELTKVKRIGTVAVDMHPSFNTSLLGAELAEKFGASVVKCQHHHAHLASLMAENHLDEIVGIAADGVGYGADGRAWGGEVMVVSFEEFKRFGSLMPQLMPGGDLAAEHPLRMAAGILAGKYSLEELEGLFKKYFEGMELKLLIKQIERRFNTPETTSTGRVLDSISALLGVCNRRTYEGEPAMKLESLALRGEPSVRIPIKIEKFEGRRILNTTEILDAVMKAKGRFKPKDIAASAQHAIAAGLSEIAVEAARAEGIKAVGISGGVAYNDAIVRTVGSKVRKEKLEFYTQSKLPCGDGGISVGQASIGAFNL